MKSVERHRQTDVPSNGRLRKLLKSDVVLSCKFSLDYFKLPSKSTAII